MKPALLAAALLAVPMPAAAQTIQGDSGVIRLTPTGPIRKNITSETRQEASSAEIAVLRGLDKLQGVSRDLTLTVGEPQEFGYLTIELLDCRYPKGNPSGDAYVHLAISETAKDASVFEGWMIASSPALMALDHPRFDVWAIGCKLDRRTPAVIAGESSPRPLMRPEGLGGNSRG